jgi:hypothetical protein
MICRKCKKSIPNTAKTCPYCGAKVKNGISLSGISPLTIFAFIASIIMLISSVIPQASFSFGGFTTYYQEFDVNSYILIIACIVAIISLFSRKINILYPICTLVIGCTYAERIKTFVDLYKASNEIKEILGADSFRKLISIIDIRYAGVFIVGFVFMVIASILLTVRTLAKK